jgi:hypothetical protein
VILVAVLTLCCHLKFVSLQISLPGAYVFSEHRFLFLFKVTDDTASKSIGDHLLVMSNQLNKFKDTKPLLIRQIFGIEDHIDL